MTTEEKIAAGNKKAVKRDFFGRVVQETTASKKETKHHELGEMRGDAGRIWVSFHEGFSNAVRKPVTIDDIMRGL